MWRNDFSATFSFCHDNCNSKTCKVPNPVLSRIYVCKKAPFAPSWSMQLALWDQEVCIDISPLGSSVVHATCPLGPGEVCIDISPFRLFRAPCNLPCRTRRLVLACQLRGSLIVRLIESLQDSSPAFQSIKH